MLVIAHRGANREALENSWSAFDLAVQGGASRIELDVQLSKDGHAVVLHDDQMERTTGVRRLISESTRSELQRIRLTNGEPIPFLDEVVSRLLPLIELNIETVRNLRASGIHAVYGDASRKETLEEAGIAHAVSLFLTAPVEVDSDAVRRARELNPDLFVAARCSFLRDVEKLRKAGADAAFSGEGEVALAMTEFMLTRLGATPEQIDRERERIHETTRADW